MYVGENIKLAKEKSMHELYAQMDSFNAQSQRMFESAGLNEWKKKNLFSFYKLWFLRKTILL